MDIKDIINENIDDLIESLLGSELDEYDVPYSEVYKYEISESIKCLKCSLRIWFKYTKRSRIYSNEFIMLLFESFSGIVCDEINYIKFSDVSCKIVNNINEEIGKTFWTK